MLNLQSHQPIVGLDIGSSAVKAVEIKPSGKRWQLLRCGLKRLPPDVIEDGRIVEMDGAVQTITDLFSENGIKTRRVAISVSGPSVIIKKIQLSPMTELELEDQIALEAEEYIPFDIEDVHLDFQILGQDNESMDVLLTACKKELINSHLEAMERAGLQPKICDLDLFCIANAYESFLSPPAPKKKKSKKKSPEEDKVGVVETVALVNAGATSLNITILQDGLPAFTRDHAFGGNQLVHSCQSRYDISLEEAERLPFLDGDSEEMHRYGGYQTQIVVPFLEQMAQQIRQSIDFHKGGNPGFGTAKILLSGGCAMLPEAELIIGDKIGIPTHKTDLLDRIQVPKNLQSSLFAQGAGSRFMVALGLALRGDMP